MFDPIGFLEHRWVKWPLTIIIVGGFLVWCVMRRWGG